MVDLTHQGLHLCFRCLPCSDVAINRDKAVKLICSTSGRCNGFLDSYQLAGFMPPYGLFTQYITRTDAREIDRDLFHQVRRDQEVIEPLSNRFLVCVTKQILCGWIPRPYN